jgi:signal transduction histidine kinase
MMNPQILEQLKACCRDEAAFVQMQQLLSLVCDPGEAEQYQVEKHQALFRVVAKIRETLNLSTIFQVAAQEVRQFLNADRVGIFRFDPASNWTEGEFVSEAVLPQFPAALSARVYDHCFGDRYASYYQQGRIQAVADIQAADLQDCHRDVLARFQIRANLVVPLLQGCHLWGLLCIHQCAAPRTWQTEEIEFASQISTQLAIALKQAELLAQTEQQTASLSETVDHLQKSQMQLVQNEKLAGLGQLVAGIAHEINNPVNFICGNLTYANQYAQHLITLLGRYKAEHAPSDPLLEHEAELGLDFIISDFPKLLDSMKIGGERIRQLVLSLRNFSRSDSMDMQPTNLHEGIDSTLLILHHRLKPRSHTRGIQVVCEYSELPPVECYANRINQVFMNLLSNAIDALEEELAVAKANGLDWSEKRPQITIRTLYIPDPQGGIPRAVVCIADNGPGVSETVQEQIFDPFFTTKPVGQGTGLGLSISREIMEQHGGELQCYSYPGSGTEFWLELPVKQLACSIEAKLPVLPRVEVPSGQNALLYQA